MSNMHSLLKRVAVKRTAAQILSVSSGFALLFFFVTCESLASARFIIAAISCLIVFLLSSVYLESLTIEEARITRAIRKSHERRLKEIYSSSAGQRAA